MNDDHPLGTFESSNFILIEKHFNKFKEKNTKLKKFNSIARKQSTKLSDLIFRLYLK